MTFESRTEVECGAPSRVAQAAGRAAVLVAALMLGACAQISELGTGGKPDAEVASAVPGQSRGQSELEKATEYWGKEVAKSPRDGKAILSYARNLKALGRKQDALTALQTAYIYNAESREYLSEYGRLALELGQVAAAASLLERADDPAKPDWRVVSARGTALAKQGQYKEAVAFFERARELAPGQASVLNNLAMAYTMDGQAEKAEGLLRQAAEKNGADPKIKQNLAMVMNLQGKKSDSEGDGADGAANATASGDAFRPKAQPAVARQPAGNGTAPVTPVESAPLDADAVIKAAMEAEAAKSAKPASAVATSSTPRARSSKSRDDVSALRSTR